MAVRRLERKRDARRFAFAFFGDGEVAFESTRRGRGVAIPILPTPASVLVVGGAMGFGRRRRRWVLRRGRLRRVASRRGDVAPRAGHLVPLVALLERTRARELVVEETPAKALRGGGVVLVRLRERHVAPAVGVVPVEAGALARGRGVGTRARGGSRGDLRGACVALVEHYGRTRGIRRRGAARGGDRRQIRRARRAPLASVGFARARGGECEGAAKSEREKTTLGTSSITILSRTEGNSLYGYLPWDGKRIKPCIHCLFHQ